MPPLFCSSPPRRQLQFGSCVLSVVAAVLIRPTRLDAAPVYPISSSSLTPASAAGSFNGNVLSSGQHNIVIQRLAGPFPNTNRDYLRVTLESLDLVNGETTFSFGAYGEYYDVQFPSSPARTVIPNSSRQPTPGVRVPNPLFYLAYTQRSEKVYPFEGYNFRYGWLQLELKAPLRSIDPINASDDLILLGGAVTDDPRGIVVGQYRTVPEPSAGSLMAAAATAGLVWRRRRFW